MKIQKICVLGGTGFVGRHLVTRLAKQGYAVNVPTRHPQRHRSLAVLQNVAIIDADIHNPDVLAAQFADCDGVINLVGILHEYAKQDFRTVHVDLPAKVVKACQTAGVRRLLHMSALHADAEKGPSQYLFTKGEGEKIVTSVQNLDVTCFKPSIIFGTDDNFYNQFAGLLKLSPIVPLASPNTHFAPVFIDDVVQAFMVALQDDATIGASYELCGPRIYTFKELVEGIARMLGLKRIVWGLPNALAQIQAKIFGLLPVKLLTTDNLLSLKVDSVCGCDGLKALGIVPHSVESIMPRHFAGQAPRRRYDEFRKVAGR
ncbi:MAG: epimerase [Candidatus Contendobacter odensis]|uniref:Epimerase n=1 Tax=Candidatus Contendibacter odensensis TaxID=1400860 RepID=A0A2G6PDR8_9GAMM|nr:MAG: epimerase [Candidatus Contendobacter odensis]